MRIKNKRGQSTVEYILLVTAVIAVLIVFLTNKNSSLSTKLNSTLQTSANDIGDMGTKLADSHLGSNAASKTALGGGYNVMPL